MSVSRSPDLPARDPLAYDFPVFRPPSEAENLILQVSVGCSFNRCTFCSMYRSKTFTARPLEDVFTTIAAAARRWPETRRIFLADGDALTLPVAHLCAILERLGESFPALQRVSAYATPGNLLKKSSAELETLRRQRLTLVYLGIETGADVLLRKIHKGASHAGLQTALAKARAAGLKISATVILGLGGQSLWQEHVAETARLVNAAPPHFLSTLQLTLQPEAVPGFLEAFETPFLPQDDAGILHEQRALLAQCAPPEPVIFRSNHASNCLPLAGTLPRHRDVLLAEIDAALAGHHRLRPSLLRGL